MTEVNLSAIKTPCESRDSTPNSRRSGDGWRERSRIKTTFPKSPSLSNAAKDVENSGPLPFAGNTEYTKGGSRAHFSRRFPTE